MAEAIIDHRSTSGDATIHTDTYRSAPLVAERRVSWAAVIAGALLAIALMVLLAMLGIGIGASTIDPLSSGDSSPSASAFGIGAGIWWGLSTLVSLFAGAWVAGRLSGMPRKAEGGLHGLLTWAIALLTTVYLVSSGAGSLLSAAGGVLGTVATVSASGAAAAAPKLAGMASEQLQKSGISFDSIKQDAMAMMSQTGKPGLQPGAIQQQAKDAATDVKQSAGSPAPSDQNFASLLDRLLSQAKGTVSQVDQDAVVNVVMARSGLSREEATQRVAGWQATADQARAKAAEVADAAKQKAREAADATAKAVSRAMLLGFLALAIGALVAWFGGSMGQARRVMD